LHDSIKQQIFTVNVSAAAAQARWESDPAGARAALQDVRTSAHEAMVEMKAMLQHLRPAPLETVGLVEALRKQCEALQYRTGAQVTTGFADLPENDRLPIGTQEAVFRIAQEALANIARHARAQNVQVRLQADAENESMWLKIHDDGQGFNTTAVDEGMGMANIRARAREIDGRLDLLSVPGEGTSLAIRIPLLATAEQVAHKQLWQGALNAFIFVTIMGLILAKTWGDKSPFSLLAIPLAVPFLLLAISFFIRVHRRIHQSASKKLSWLKVLSGAFRNWGN
jgi:signal transduction histidine kinase